MTLTEAAQLLKTLSALDGRASSDEVAVAWAWALEDVSLEDAHAALREHQTGEQRHKFFTQAHIRDYLDARDKRADREMEGMVMTARGLGLVTGYPAALTPEQQQRVIQWREKNHQFGVTELSSGSGKGIELGDVGRGMPA